MKYIVMANGKFGGKSSNNRTMAESVAEQVNHGSHMTEQASGIEKVEYLNKMVSLLEGIEIMNRKIGDNYDVLDGMKAELLRILGEMKIIKVPETKLDDESRNIILSAPDRIMDEINKQLEGKLDEFNGSLGKILENAKVSLKKTVDDGTTKVTNAVDSAQEDISKFKGWCSRWMWYFIGSIIWAIISSVGFIRQCSSANSDHEHMSHRIDSLQAEYDMMDMNSVILLDFIQNNKKIKKEYDVWKEKSLKKYSPRFQEINERKDSIQKLMKEG